MTYPRPVLLVANGEKLMLSRRTVDRRPRTIIYVLIQIRSRLDVRPSHTHRPRKRSLSPHRPLAPFFSFLRSSLFINFFVFVLELFTCAQNDPCPHNDRFIASSNDVSNFVRTYKGALKFPDKFKS